MNVLLTLYSIALFVQTVTCCAWNLKTDLPKNDPIYMLASEDAELLIPGSKGLMLETGEPMKLACPGKSNVINGTKEQEIVVVCTKDNQLEYNNVALPLNSYTCVNSTLSVLVFTGMPCAGGKGEFFQIGFNSTNKVAPLFYLCYDRIYEAIFYSVNSVHGEAVEGAETNGTRPSFRTPGLTYGTMTANQYKQTEQKTRFTTLLGKDQSDKYLTNNSFLARGHISPDADFLFDTWSAASYFYVNVAPEWQVVNGGNWFKIEDLTRDIAVERREKLVIYTGVYGVLQLPDSIGQMVDIYLMTEKRLPVPKYFWKVIHSESTSEGIALITLNNPHIKEMDVADIFCSNICKETLWDRKEWPRLDKGFTFCCDANELINIVGTMPLLNILRNMTGPLLSKYD